MVVGLLARLRLVSTLRRRSPCLVASLEVSLASLLPRQLLDRPPRFASPLVLVLWTQLLLLSCWHRIGVQSRRELCEKSPANRGAPRVPGKSSLVCPILHLGGYLDVWRLPGAHRICQLTVSMCRSGRGRPEGPQVGAVREIGPTLAPSSSEFEESSCFRRLFLQGIWC